MIDLHCHILPGIDDGAKTIEDSIDLIKEEQRQGVDSIMFTPHFNFERTDIQIFQKRRQRSMQALSDALVEQNINISLKTGSEVYFSVKLMEEDIDPLCFGDSNYILIEFPVNSKPYGLEVTIDNLIRRGYIPILAHVERYKEVQENVNIIYDCIKEGALIQVNSSSIIGKNGKEAERVNEILLNNNMIHFIATDAHSSTRRRPIIRETYDYIVRKYGEQKAEMLFIQNPYKVIEDKEISIESPRKYEKSKGFFKKLFKK